MTELKTLQMRYDLPTSLAKILILLVENSVVTPEMIEHEHQITKDAKVAIHRLRRRIAPFAVEVKSRRDIGYWIEASGRETVRKAMVPDQLSLPLEGGKTAAAA